MLHAELIAPVHVLLARHAAARGDAVAFEDAGRGVTYAALAARTAGMAAALQARGVGPGDAVALCLPNGVAWVECCLAILRAGAVAVPISHDATAAEIAYRIEDSGCRHAYASPARADAFAACAVLAAAEGAGDGGAAARDPDDLDTVAFLVYTSGTTGRAKGVMLTLRSMLWVVAACWAPIVGLGPDDRVLSPLPLFHSYALNLSVLGILATGARAFIMERFSTTEALARLAGGGYTLLPGVPTMFHYLLDAARREGRRDLGALRLCVSAGAIMPAALNAAFEAATGVLLLDGYGITETATMVTMNWPRGTRVAGSCGLPLPGLAVRIVDPADDADVPPGAEGELIVRGPNVMRGYHAKPDATAAALRAGWYRTGDLARADAHGFITITGRLKELIIRGGQNIAPAEVEEAVVAFAAVQDCAVVGIAHATLGEVPVAFVVPREGAAFDEAALRAHCATLLSAYKVPHAVRVVEAIPRTGSGKVMRFRLRELLGDAPL